MGERETRHITRTTQVMDRGELKIAIEAWVATELGIRQDQVRVVFGHTEPDFRVTIETEEVRDDHLQ